MLATVLALSLGASPAFAAIASSFSPPALSPISTSKNYTGANNGTIVNTPVVPGKVFDRYIQIWYAQKALSAATLADPVEWICRLENTDFASAASSPVFQSLASKGMLMSGYHGVRGAR